MLQVILRRGARGAINCLASAESFTAQLTAKVDCSQGEDPSSPNHQNLLRTSASLLWQDRRINLPALSLVPPPRPLPSGALPSWHYPRHYSSTPAENENKKRDEKTCHFSPTSRPHNGTWVDALPASWLPYAHLSRLEKPIGTWLLAWPCFWSIGLAASPGSFPDLGMLALFGAGAVLLRGAGCTVNDLWDRDLDRKVERTRARPLASGAVTPAQAVGWLGAQLALGLGILVQLNTYSQVLGASSLALVVAYPLMKRITGWPQAFLGLTFNWGALLGWSAVHGSCDWSVVLPLYCSGVAWTLVYDTIYAHQDKKDDVAAGIRSTALTFGKYNRHYLTGFGALNVACLMAAGQAAGCRVPFYFGVAAAAAHLGWQIATVDFDNEQDCGNKFRSNSWYGALLFAGIAADRVLSSGVAADAPLAVS